MKLTCHCIAMAMYALHPIKCYALWEHFSRAPKQTYKKVSTYLYHNACYLYICATFTCGNKRYLYLCIKQTSYFYLCKQVTFSSVEKYNPYLATFHCLESKARWKVNYERILASV